MTEGQCPNCSGSKAPTEPLCSVCWHELPPEDQQLLASTYNGEPQLYAYCLAAAVEKMRARTDRAAARRKTAASRSLARRSGAGR